MQRLLGKRLQTQLLVWTALILVISVTGLFEIRMYLNLSTLEQNLRDRSETTATAVEKALSIGVPGVDVTTLGGRLLEFAEADRTLDRLDIVKRAPFGVKILASSAPTPEPLIQSIPSVLTTNTRESN